VFLLHVFLKREHRKKDKNRCNQKFEYLVSWAYHGHETIRGSVRQEYRDCAKYLILIDDLFFERSVNVMSALGLFLFLASCAASASAGCGELSLRAASGLQASVSGTPTERLQTAIRDGDASRVAQLLDAGADPNAPDARGNPPLLQAAWNGNTAVITKLLDHGANVNGRNAETGTSALFYAVLSGRETTVRLLLPRGARVDFRYRDNQTVLHIAAGQGNPAIAKDLIAAHADVNAVDQRDRTPLDEAILHDQLATVLLLLNSGADIHRVHTVDGRGPLHEACIKGFANVVRPLVVAGADPAGRDRFGLTPLDLALDYKNENAVAALLHSDTHSEAIGNAAAGAMEHAVLRGQTEIAKLLIQGGLPLNRRTSEGSTYLSDAALKGKKEVVQLLLAHGANVNAENQTGGTPLHDAALGGNPDVIKLLLDHGARIDAQDKDSDATPLMVAASLGRSGAVAILLQSGANANRKDRFGRTALDRARQANDPATIKLLETGIGAHSGSARSQNGR
jgi:cytohesin